MVNESSTFIVDGQEVDAWGRPVGEGDEEVGYDSWTSKQLMSEIDRRNQDREDDDQVVVAGRKKSDAVKALEEDDKAHPEEEGEEE
jgi:hypothetical protein